jgi:hypothetical protein
VPADAPTPKVRLAVAADVPTVAAVHVRTWQATYVDGRRSGPSALAWACRRAGEALPSAHRRPPPPDLLVGAHAAGLAEGKGIDVLGTVFVLGLVRSVGEARRRG